MPSLRGRGRKGQEQALEDDHRRTQDSPLSPERQHRSLAIWRPSPGPRHKGLGCAFAHSCACLGPGDGKLGPSSMLGVGGVSWPQLGGGGSHGGGGGVPQAGMLHLLPGSWLQDLAQMCPPQVLPRHLPPALPAPTWSVPSPTWVFSPAHVFPRWRTCW